MLVYGFLMNGQLFEVFGFYSLSVYNGCCDSGSGGGDDSGGSGSSIRSNIIIFRAVFWVILFHTAV
jgi:hypothetical protein